MAITRGVGGGGDKGYGDCMIMGPECSEVWKHVTSDQKGDHMITGSVNVSAKPTL